LAGQPFLLRDWQKEIIRDIYGPVDADGKRAVRQAVISMGRKNGKSTLAAALVLVHLIGPESEQRGQVYSCAADRAQAALIFQEAAAMVMIDPELSQIVNIIESTKRLVHMGSGSVYAALSRESRSKHGFSASFIVFDELAQMPDRKLYDTLMTSTGARSEPLALIISTQSSDPNHLMSELVDYGKQINDGTLSDPTFAAFQFEVPDESDPWDEKNWYLANPALGDFRDLNEMRNYAEQAKRMPSREASFRSLYLNQRVDADERFLNATDWLACKAEIDPDSLRGHPCWGGLDLGSTRDLTALVLVFPDQGQYLSLSWFWVPADNLQERADRDRVPYPVWRDDGLLTATPGRAIDRRYIAKQLAEIESMFDVRGIAYDRWRMEDLTCILNDEGIDLPLIPWGQGYRDMGPAVDALEAAILDQKLAHDGNPILTWNASNAVVTQDPTGARKLAKDRSRDRIDGLVALAMALGLHGRQGDQSSCIYDDRDLLVI